MSKWHEGRERNKSLRELTRYTVWPLWREGNIVGYRVRPRGFATPLFDVSKPEHVSEIDFQNFMGSVRTLSDLPFKD